jgi:Zn-dependent peptidase ImmA (M78 family)/transcriptional regulator with XRE-family HTH domain
VTEEPNFRMLRLAREMRGMSQASVAEATGLPQAILSRIETGIQLPKPGQLAQIANALEFPVGFFTEPEAPAAVPLFRKRAIRSVKSTRMIQARINVAVLAARRILDAGVVIDTPLSFPEPGEIPSDDPIQAARIIRSAWRLPNGRVDNVTKAIEAAGGIVLHVDFGTDAASAAFVSTLTDPRLWFLVNTRETAGDRVRLSLAHELGHAALHRFIPVEDERRIEEEAYAFATAFTLPAEEFDHNVPADLTLRQARDLKRSYWISIQAIVRAARDRGLISPSRYSSLCKQVSARGWRREEPNPIKVERPSVWANGLGVHRHLHGYDEGDLAGIARLTVADLSALFPNDFPPRFRVLNDKRHSYATTPRDGSRLRVV